MTNVTDEELKKIVFIYQNISNIKKNMWLSNGQILLASQVAEENEQQPA